MLTDVRLRAERLERLRLHFPGLPMREGRYYVDVGVGTEDGRAELALAERALELTVFGQDQGASGPDPARRDVGAAARRRSGLMGH